MPVAPGLLADRLSATTLRIYPEHALAEMRDQTDCAKAPDSWGSHMGQYLTVRARRKRPELE
jgi:hypothetical protein